MHVFTPRIIVFPVFRVRFSLGAESTAKHYNATGNQRPSRQMKTTLNIDDKVMAELKCQTVGQAAAYRRWLSPHYTVSAHIKLSYSPENR
jgi:hypothetical protein